MLKVADRGGGGVKFAKILLTSYVNAPLPHIAWCKDLVSSKVFVAFIFMYFMLRDVAHDYIY